MTEREERIYDKLSQAISMAGFAVNKLRVTYDDSKRDTDIQTLIQMHAFFKANPSVGVAFYESLMARFRQAADETLF